jgi:hypothetical protein
LFAVVVRTGLVDDGHFTDAGHVALLPPVPSCFKNSIKLLPTEAVGNVNEQFAVNVKNCMLPKSSVMVYEEPVFAEIVSSV